MRLFLRHHKTASTTRGRVAARRTPALRLLVATGAVVSLALTAAPAAFAAAVIDNGTVRLGVNDEGQLNFSNTGVQYIPTGNDGTRGGCPCEGWGAGAGGPTQFQGRANENRGVTDVSPVSFTSTGSTATSVVDVLRGGTPALRVTHEFKPSTTTPNLYDVDITLKNLTSDTLTNVRYERIMDWDVEPTAFDEFVTIQRGSAADLFYSDDNGFSDNLPFTFEAEGDGPLDPTTVNTNYTDKGPTDHGARFTFDFGSLAAGAEKKFTLNYGAAGTEAEANTAVAAGSLEVFSYGQPNTAEGPSLGTPNTFIWGFRGVGGVPIFPACADGKDNDGDGKVDFPDDPGCSSAEDDDETDPPPPPKQCADGKDNDGDGKIDHPADPGCSSAEDDSESPDPPPPPTTRCTISGTRGNDIIRGTRGDDVICAGAGNDIVYGRGGNDIIRGGSGNDVLRGEGGNDIIRGGSGNDVLRGGDGDDRLSGGDGNDVLRGGDGDDRLVGGPGRDVLSGSGGRDFLDTRDNRGGNDHARGGPGDDDCDTDRGDVRSSC